MNIDKKKMHLLKISFNGKLIRHEQIYFEKRTY